MKLVVLGKSGQLSTELIRIGSEEGHDITGFDFSEINVRDAAAVRAMLEKVKPSVVINTTAFHVVPLCEKEPEQAFMTNAIAVMRMAELCGERTIGFVTYSTDYVFDGTKGKPYREDDRPNPLQVYGMSKLAGEILALQYHPAGIVIRTNGLYGGQTGSPMKKGNFVLSVLKESEKQSQLEVSSEQTVNPTYSVDLATATLQLLGKKAPGGIYHLGSSGSCTWAEFATKIIEIKRRNMTIVPVDHGGKSGAMQRPLFSVIENTKAKKLGVTMPQWDDAIRRYLETLP